MGKLQIYGVTRSRAMRALWLANELGLDFVQHELNFAGGDLETVDYRAINPNARIPAIDDDGFRLWESMAINLYLAKKHGGELAPRDPREEALALQWSFWVMAEVEKPTLNVLFNRVLRPEEERDSAVADQAEQELQRPLAVLNGALEGRDWLVGDRFTVADLNVAAVLAWAKMGQLDMAAWPALTAWLDRCLSRPAVAKTMAG
ncbi:MAG: glutathione S-transferase family protein [Alphaproteobacteria bacterium]|jgi:glutathione S-transferase|nr:glutathione S-transferase family protein [Alphaproteobacteria bacterium]MDP6565232.1 glutathione S-transferase family protein [Alphaproteobacteria bacterium]MDP6812814.1 glutathione S-transferase family protein [Alphaproteobacteria bacterium]